MSNYRAPAFNPISGKVENADWIDNHFGHHIYGVRFSDGTLCHAYEVGLEAAAKRIEELGRQVECGSGKWQPIETAPRPQGDEPLWVIGYTSWGQEVGKFHEWVGPCEWYGDHFEFSNTDFDVFPRPTHWMEWPAPLGQSASPSSTEGQ